MIHVWLLIIIIFLRRRTCERQKKAKEILAKKAEFRAELKQKAADQHKHLSAQQHKTKKGGTQSIHPTLDSTWNHPRQLQTSSGVWSSPWKAARTLHKPTRRTGSLWTFPSRHRPLRLWSWATEQCRCCLARDYYTWLLLPLQTGSMEELRSLRPCSGVSGGWIRHPESLPTDRSSTFHPSWWRPLRMADP